MSPKLLALIIFLASLSWVIFSFFYYGFLLNDSQSALILGFLGFVVMYFTFEPAFVGPKRIEVVKNGESPGQKKNVDEHIQILKNRYAKGEITKKEYEEMKKEFSQEENNNNYYWNCEYCNREFETERGCEKHEKECKARRKSLKTRS